MVSSVVLSYHLITKHSVLCTVLPVKIRVTIMLNIQTRVVAPYSNNLFIKLPVLVRLTLSSFSVPLSRYENLSLWFPPERFLSDFVLENGVRWRCFLNSVAKSQAWLQSGKNKIQYMKTDVHLWHCTNVTMVASDINW